MYTHFTYLFYNVFNDYLNKKKKKGGTLYHVSMVINQFSYQKFEIIIIDGQNLTQIKYKQLSNTNQWNPCIQCHLYGIYQYHFVDNKSNNFRDWYPLEICDYPYNFVSYKNDYLFHSD